LEEAPVRPEEGRERDAPVRKGKERLKEIRRFSTKEGERPALIVRALIDHRGQAQKGRRMALSLSLFTWVAGCTRKRLEKSTS